MATDKEKAFDIYVYVPACVSFCESDFDQSDETFDQVLTRLKDPITGPELRAEYFWENFNSENMDIEASDTDLRLDVFDNVKGGAYYLVEQVNIGLSLKEVEDLIDLCSKAQLDHDESYIGELKDKLKNSLTKYGIE